MTVTHMKQSWLIWSIHLTLIWYVSHDHCVTWLLHMSDIAWAMPQMWRRHTHMHAYCRTHRWLMSAHGSHICMRVVAHACQRVRQYACICVSHESSCQMTHVSSWLIAEYRFVSHMCEGPSCHTYQHIYMSHTTNVNEAHTWTSHVTQSDLQKLNITYNTSLSVLQCVAACCSSVLPCVAVW